MRQGAAPQRRSFARDTGRKSFAFIEAEEDTVVMDDLELTEPAVFLPRTLPGRTSSKSEPREIVTKCERSNGALASLGPPPLPPLRMKRPPPRELPIPQQQVASWDPAGAAGRLIWEERGTIVAASEAQRPTSQLAPRSIPPDPASRAPFVLHLPPAWCTAEQRRPELGDPRSQEDVLSSFPSLVSDLACPEAIARLGSGRSRTPEQVRSEPPGDATHRSNIKRPLLALVAVICVTAALVMGAIQSEHEGASTVDQEIVVSASSPAPVGDREEPPKMERTPAVREPAREPAHETVRAPARVPTVLVSRPTPRPNPRHVARRAPQRSNPLHERFLFGPEDL
jgi:hypothetical protein